MNTVEKYIIYVQEKIEKIKKAVESLNKIDAQVVDVRDVLANRFQVTMTLQMEYQRMKADYKSEKMKFDIWWADKYAEMRKELNPDSKPGSKWLSKSDIESEAIRQNKQEYINHRSSLEDIENQKEFLRSLIDAWGSIQFDITHLLKILDQELYMSGDSISPRKRRIQG